MDGKNNNPIPNPKELFNEVKLEGIYYLKVTNTNTGCTAFDSVEVTSDPNRPQGIVIERNNPTCYGYKDGYIKVAKIEGAHLQSYTRLMTVHSPPSIPGLIFQVATIP